MRINPDERYYLKLKACYYYYEEKLTQETISKMLNISRPTLAKFLKEALEEGMVEIKINDLRNKNDILKLEVALKKAYDLEDVKVVDYVKDDYEEIIRRLGQAAANYFARVVKSGMKVGIAWGKTLENLVDNLEQDTSKKDIQVVTLIGGSPGADSKVQANVLCEKILQNYNGRSHFLYAPLIVDNKEVLEALMQNKETMNVLDLARNVDVALLGIGGPIELSTILDTGYFQNGEVKQLKEERAVGDICARFFDINGKLCNSDLNERTIAIQLDDLKHIEKVIAVAGGQHKVKSVLGALKGKYINVLITDKGVAEQLLDIHKKKYKLK